MTDLAASPATTPAAPGRFFALPRLGGVVPWLYLAPALALLWVWTYLPVLQAAELSLKQWNMLPTAPQRFVGLTNYQRLLALPEMQIALRNTGFYILGLLPLSVITPLVIALATQDLGPRARALYRGLVFVPMIVAPVVAAVLWRWLLNEDHGLINAGLAALGFGTIGFLTDPRYALASLTWITGWKLVGFSTLLFSAANGAINPSYVEAARMDGARRWQIVRDVRLPLLSPTILLLTMMTILFGAQWSFAYIHVLTNGGPLKSTTNIFYLMWEYGFETLAAGWSAAAGMLTFGGLALIALVCLAAIRRFAVYDA